MGSFCPTAVSDFRSIEEDGRVVRSLKEVSAGGLNIKCLETLDVILLSWPSTQFMTVSVNGIMDITRSYDESCHFVRRLLFQ